MAWIDELTQMSQTQTWLTPTHLYYSVRSPDDALLVADFERAAQQIEHFDFTLAVSGEGSRITAEQIVDKLGQDISSAHVYFCGPEAMRESLRKSLTLSGLPPDNFHYEEFEIRTSLGIRRLLNRFAR